MNITLAQYTRNIEDTKNENIKVIIDGTEMTVPLDPANRHYIAILEWAKIDGNTIEDAD
tara:strand:- start:2560 stop:2736 length:177 start_codon:yes stop_codon:yes gene_type:complete